MKVWLHRISHCGNIAYDLLENNYLSIGFSDFSNKDFLEKTIAGDIEFFNNQIIEKWNDLKRSRHSLWRFINEFKEWDLVLVPLWGAFSIYKLEGSPNIINKDLLDNKFIEKGFKINEDGKLYENNTPIDIGFVWKVTPIATNIPRKDIFERALISRMKIRNTNADITDLKDIIENKINQWENNDLSTFYSTLLDSILGKVENNIRENLTPDKFEQLVKWYFNKIGASDVYIPAKNEANKENGADADVIATFEPIKVIIYVQVKHHLGCTSDWAINQIKEYKMQKESMNDEYTYISWVITSGDSFSSLAIKKAKEEEVRLIDKTEFSKMLIDVGFSDINSAFN
ncbi:restriction endonuclease [Paraclostridium bifermentans]|uniref:restriction endonuclease n=1 Tax=Paraclostridium bifermentans TaxID=1490 RepID=UPI00359CB7AF